MKFLVYRQNSFLDFSRVFPQQKKGRQPKHLFTMVRVIETSGLAQEPTKPPESEAKGGGAKSRVQEVVPEKHFRKLSATDGTYGSKYWRNQALAA